MRFNGRATTDAQQLTALVAADGATGGFLKDDDLDDIASGYLYGMTLSNNGTDATNDIDVASGKCVDSTAVRKLSGGAMTKQLDAAWASGTNAGGRMSAAAIANTTYHVFAILKDSDNTVDYGFDVSATAPTMPTGYTYFRRIGSVIRASGALLGFSQRGDEFLLNVPVRDFNATDPGASAVLRVLTVPLGIKVSALLTHHLIDLTSTTATLGLLTSPDQTDTTPSTTVFNFRTDVAGATGFISCTAEIPTRTDTSGQVRTRLSQSSADHIEAGVTRGWIDTRGRLS